MIFLSAFIAILLILSGHGAGSIPFYLKPIQIMTGRIDIATWDNYSMMLNQNTYDYLFDNPINSTLDYINAGISLISFEGIISNQIAFNLTISQLNPNNIQVKVKAIGNTYFSIMSFHFIVSQMDKF